MNENEAVSPESSKPEPSKPGERPRPRYGELAPEGWEWKPPAPPTPEPEAPVVAPAPPAASQSTPGHPVPPAAGPYAPGRPGAAPESLRTDRRITVALLIVGLFGLWMAINTLSTIPEALQMLHSQAGLDDFVASQDDMRTILLGNIVQGVLWVLTAVWAGLRMQRARRAFWIPLVGGALSVIALFIVVGVIAVNDPLFLQLAPTS